MRSKDVFEQYMRISKIKIVLLQKQLRTTMNNISKHLAVAALAVCSANVTFASESNSPNKGESEFSHSKDSIQIGAKTAIQRELEATLSNKLRAYTYIEPIEGTPLHAVNINGEYHAVNEDLSLVIQGGFYDFVAKRDLKQQWIKKTLVPELKGMPEENYVVYPATGETIDTLWVLSDLSCGYCKAFHEQFDSLNAMGVEIRVVPFVRGLNGSVSKRNYDNTMAIYSTSDQSQRRALQKQAFNGVDIGAISSIDKEADKILQHGWNLGLKAELTGTPMLINNHGVSTSGVADNRFILEKLLPAR